jgi:hypothetical protein
MLSMSFEKYACFGFSSIFKVGLLLALGVSSSPVKIVVLGDV